MRCSYLLVDKDTAIVGERFYFRKSLACIQCKFKNICLKDKEEGMLYEIVEVNKPMEKVVCKVIDKEAYLAKIKPADIRISIPTKDMAIATPIYYHPLKCGEISCPYIIYCNFRLPDKKDKILIRVKKKISELDCPLGLKLSLVEAEFL